MVSIIPSNNKSLGLPLKKMPPQSEEDLVFKLNQKFTSGKDLLNFFESNRDMFKTQESYGLLLSRLLGFVSIKKDKSQKDQVNYLNEPQFKVLLTDYNRFLGNEYEKYKKFSHKKPLYDEFIPVFTNLIILHKGNRFKGSLPDNVKITYQRMMKDDIYLRTLTSK